MAATVGLLLLVGWIHRRGLEAAAVEGAQARLAAVADLGLRAVEAVRADVSLDVRVLAQSPSLLDGDLAATGQWLNYVAEARRFHGAWLVDADGRVLAAAGDRADRLDHGPAGVLTRARVEGGMAVSPLFLDGEDAVFDVAALAGDGRAVLVARLSARERLEPVLAAWPSGSRSGELLLVQREGQDVAWATRLRFSTAPPLSLRRPLTAVEFPAVRAAAGAEGFLSGSDYRGEEVFAWVRRVAGLPWALVAKIDRAEVLEPARQAAWRDGLVLAALAAMAWATTWAWARRQERAVEEAEARAAERARHAALLDQLDEGVVAVGPDRRIQSWNGAAERIYGWRAEEVVGRPVAEVLQPEGAGEGDGPRVEAGLARLGRFQAEQVHRRKDGSPIDVDLRITALRGPGGEVVGFVGAHRDVTAARQAREALARSEQQLRLIAGHVPAGVFVCDAAGDNRWVNQGLAEIAGREPDALLAKGWLQAIHPDDLDAFGLALDRARASAQDRLTLDLRMVRPGGDLRHVHVVALPLGPQRGGDWIGVALDLTEEQRLAERAARAERLAGLGALSAGMAHRVNNPLAALLATVRFARAELEAAGDPRLAEAAAALGEAEEDGRRIAAIVRDLESFAAPGEAGGLHDLGEVVREAVRLSDPDLAARARLELSLEPVPLVHGERSDLRQLCLHLLGNAWRSIPEGRPERHVVSVRTGTDARGAAVLTVRDDGSGLGETARRRAFDPFGGAAPAPGDPGLGLAVCWSIVRGLGGTLDLDSQPGRGTVALVAIPAARRAGPGGAETAG